MKKLTYFLLLAVSLSLISCNNSNEAKGDKATKNDNREEAIKCYALAVAEDSTNTEVINKLALAYNNNHQPEKAKECYKLGAKRGNEKAAKMLGSMCFRDGDYENAIAYCKPFADKGDNGVVYDLGSSYYNLQQYDEALKYLLMDKTAYIRKT